MAFGRSYSPASIRWFHATGDLERVRKITFVGIDFDPPNEQMAMLVEKRVNWLADQTEKLIRTFQGPIEAMASHLLEVGELTGEEARIIFYRSGGKVWTFPENYNLFELPPQKKSFARHHFGRRHISTINRSEFGEPLAG